MSIKITKLETGDILLSPLYYYTAPYKFLESAVGIGAYTCKETIIKSIKTLIGENGYDLLTKYIPVDSSPDDVSVQSAKAIINFFGNKYIHSEIYLKNGWVLSAYTEGSKLVKYKPDSYAYFDVYRADGINKDTVLDLVDKYWNLPYDYTSTTINAIIEFISAPMKNLFGMQDVEDKIENFLPYDNKNKVMCSELVSRILEESGFKFNEKLEFISPSDLASFDGIRKI